MSIFRCEKNRNQAEKVINQAYEEQKPIMLDGVLYENIKGYDGLYWVFDSWDDRVMLVVNWSDGKKMFLYNRDGVFQKNVKKYKVLS